MKGALETLTDYMYLIIAIVIGGLMFYFIAQNSGFFGGSSDISVYGDSAQVSKRIATEIEECWAKHRGGLDSLSDVCNELQVNSTQDFSEWTVTKALDCRKIPNNYCSIGNCSFCFSPNYDDNDRLGWSVKNRNAFISISYSGSERRVMVQEIVSSAKVPRNGTIPGDKDLPKFNGSCVALEYNGDPEKNFDIVFVGDNYRDTTQIHSDSLIHMANILAYEPFKSNEKRINFYYINATGNSLCMPGNNNEPDKIACSRIIPQAYDCPADQMIIIEKANLSGRGGYFCIDKNPIGIVFSNGAKEEDVRQIGYSFGCLNYENYGEGISVPQNPRDKPLVNCDNDSSCQRWNNIAGTGCYPGCTYDSWYRPTNSCIMGNSSQLFCQVCLKQLLSKLSPYGFIDPAYCQKTKSVLEGSACNCTDQCRTGLICNPASKTCKNATALDCSPAALAALVDSSGMYSDVGAMSSSGRVYGSNSANANWIKSKLESYGLENVHFETFNGGTGTNVVGELGSGSTIIVLGGHRDSVSGCPACVDNAAGTSSVMEIARVLSKCKTKITGARLKFVLFDGEEVGLYGSRAYLGAHTSDGIGGMINFDCLGDNAGTGLATITNTNRQTGTVFRDSADKACTKLGINCVREFGSQCYSDFCPFAEAGIGYLYFDNRGPFTCGRCYHCYSCSDNIQGVDKTKLEQAAKIAVFVVADKYISQS